MKKANWNFDFFLFFFIHSLFSILNTFIFRLFLHLLNLELQDNYPKKSFYLNFRLLVSKSIHNFLFLVPISALNFICLYFNLLLKFIIIIMIIILILLVLAIIILIFLTLIMAKNNKNNNCLCRFFLFNVF